VINEQKLDRRHLR